MTLRIICLLIFIVGTFSCKSSKQSSTSTKNPYTFTFVEFDKLSEVLDVAIEEDKLLFLDIYTDWCLPCQIMNEEVFTDKRLGKFYNENFVSYKVNAEKESGPIIAELYKVAGYPTLLFLDHKGKVLLKKNGVAYSREMYELAEEALAISSEKLGE